MYSFSLSMSTQITLLQWTSSSSELISTGINFHRGTHLNIICTVVGSRPASWGSNFTSAVASVLISSSSRCRVSCKLLQHFLSFMNYLVASIEHKLTRNFKAPGLGEGLLNTVDYLLSHKLSSHPDV